MKLVYDGIVKYYDKYDGFVVLTGTDTLAYLASFLSFWLQDIQSPVIITGSQKPLNEMGSDAPGNIYYSILFARKYTGNNCFLRRKTISWKRVIKVDSRGFHAFDSYKYPSIGHVDAFTLSIHKPLESLSRPQKKKTLPMAGGPHMLPS